MASWRTLALPKAGLHERDYEDAAAGPVAMAAAVRFAVADGATESAYAGRWARALAEAAAGASLEEAVEAARVTYHAELPASGPAWYAEAKREEGAFATVLALTLHDGWTWSAQAVGDCALLHLRAGRLHASWPFSDPADFTTRPPLVASRADLPLPPVLTTASKWRPRDRFLLCTDALAAYLLANDPAEVLDLDPDAFQRFIAHARAHGMRNDDVTLVDVAMGAG